MQHLQPFKPRRVLALPTAHTDGWQLKRYAILADNKNYDPSIAASALDAAITRLPTAGRLEDPDGNHGIGFQIVHFAQVAVVSPVFYWMWGSVLANTEQMRAPWNNPTVFKTGVPEVVGCLWEMQIVAFESRSWRQTILNGNTDQLPRYLRSHPDGIEYL